MGFFSPPSPPAYQPPPPPPAPLEVPATPPPVIKEVAAPEPLPTPADPAVTKAREQNRKAAANNAGRNASILTSPQGVKEEANTTGKKSLLGQ